MGEFAHKSDLIGAPITDGDKKLAEQMLADSVPRLKEIKSNISTVLYGLDREVDMSLACLLAGGHLLTEGPPGGGKTTLVVALAHSFNLHSMRTQGTSDLMPSDILGSEVYIKGRDGEAGDFKLVKGPIFTNLLLADELNRAPEKTQSALLQAMQEEKVTIGAQTHTLPRPFHLLAAQNPREQHGTNPLPEALLDRLMIKVDMMFPSEAAERRITAHRTGTHVSLSDLHNARARGKDAVLDLDYRGKDAKLPAVMDGGDLYSLQILTHSIPLSEELVDAIVTLTRRCRPDDPKAGESVKKWVEGYGPGPRTEIAFGLMAKGLAVLRGSLSPSMKDLGQLIDPVLQHRLHLKYSRNVDAYAEVKSEITRGLDLGLK